MSCRHYIRQTMIDHFYSSSSRCRKCHHYIGNICAAVSSYTAIRDEGHIICHWAPRSHTGVRGTGQLSSIRISTAW